jgi:hypothetical protein
MNNEIFEIIQSMPVLDLISKFNIIDKSGRKSNLIPNAEQIEIVETLENDRDTIVLKPRQIGSSTIIVAYLFALAYQSTEPVTYAILSYKLSSSKHLLNIAKTIYNFLPVGLRRELDVDNSTEISFRGGGRLIAAASSQKGGLRSFTASKLMISEYAFSENPEELKATALAALNDGQLIIESTANYYNDCLHQEIIKTQIGEADYNYLFFDWAKHQEYRLDIPDAFELTEEETKLQKEHDLDTEQIAWRREKISKVGWEKFVREYPLTLEEAYRISGTTYFKHTDFQYISVLEVDGTEWTTFEEPIPDHSYAIGVDTSGGVGRDYSVIFVVSKNTGQPVCIFRSNRISPIELAEYIVTLSHQYNNALILIEANNYGLATINEVSHQTGKLWKDPNGKDFLTTAKSKPLLFENLKKKIQGGLITQIDSITMTELRSITVNQRGIIKFSEVLESHSDNAMAMTLAYWCLDSVKIKETAYLPEWIKSMKANRTKTKQAAYRRY